MNEQRTVGLRQLIAAAPTDTQVEIFLRQARSFDMISAKTLRACERSAKRRLKQLKNL